MALDGVGTKLRSWVGAVRAGSHRSIPRRRRRTAGDAVTDDDSDLNTYGYDRGVPDEQRAFEIFHKRWSSGVPGTSETGVNPLFHDERITWMIDQLGDVAGMDVLELGPLEGGHSTMLEQRGANVTAIEANRGAFLRCLIVKNHLGLRSRFVLGDFTHPDHEFGRHDLIVASGVLYHQRDPVDLLVRLSRTTDRLFLWTHYFEEDLDLWGDGREAIERGRWDLEHPTEVLYDGHRIRLVPAFYREWGSTFSGGTEGLAHWIVREDLLTLLGLLGYDDVTVAKDDPGGLNGPSFCVLAQRTATGPERSMPNGQV